MSIIWAPTPFEIAPSLILAGYRGSLAHNTYIPSTDASSIDDIDVAGVVVPPVEYTLGTRKWEQSSAIVNEWDTIIYDYRKFLNHLTNQNPNMLCLLFLRPQHYLKWTLAGQLMIENRKIFQAKTQAYKTYRGYAKDEMLRLLKIRDQGYLGAKRKALLQKHGYDTKSASHMIRILKMGAEYLLTGTLNVFREDDGEFLRGVKRGEWSLEFVQDAFNFYDKKLTEAYNNSPLPDEIDYDKVNALAVAVAERHYHDQNSLWPRGSNRL